MSSYSVDICPEHPAAMVEDCPTCVAEFEAKSRLLTLRVQGLQNAQQQNQIAVPPEVLMQVQVQGLIEYVFRDDARNRLEFEWAVCEAIMKQVEEAVAQRARQRLIVPGRNGQGAKRHG